MNISTPTRLALLGTMADLHREPLAYDLACLRALVVELAPDLLCAEITQEMWEAGKLADADIEVREALGPVVALTDTVLVPIAPSSAQFTDFRPQRGWRQSLALASERFLRWGLRIANTPAAVNGVVFGAFCHTLCHLNEALWTAQDRSAWDEQNQRMAENILRALRRDPGRRMLVAVRCQRLHWLLPRLKEHAQELEIVSYREL
jgi:hypothetical protein